MKSRDLFPSNRGEGRVSLVRPDEGPPKPCGNSDSAGGVTSDGLPIICSDLHCIISDVHEIYRRKFHLWSSLDRISALA